MRKLHRIIFLMLLVALFIGFIRVSGLGDFLSLANIKKHRFVLQQGVEQHYWKSVLLFIASYAAAVAVSFPSASLLTLVGGFLFGVVSGTLYSVVGATAGAIILFVVVRYFFNNNNSSPYQGEKTSGTARAIQEHGAQFLLFLRLIAIVPFFMVNIAAALSHISLWEFVWTTFVGIIPGSAVYAYAGKQLNQINSFADIVSPSVFLAFVLLGLLALIPVFLKKEKWSEKREK